MKTSKLIFAIAALGFLLISCTPVEKKETKFYLDDFETVALGNANVTADSANAKFVNGNAVFTVNTGGIWNGGTVCSAQTDTVTADYTNEYSSITGSGAPIGGVNSKKYGVVYGPATLSCTKDSTGYYFIHSIMLTNSTYTYRTILNGNTFSKKFVTGDWFKVIITGYKNGIQTGQVEYYLADFRNGKSFILKTWTSIELSGLGGEVDKVIFTFDSSDKGQWGINTPTYVCIDNIYFTQNYSFPLGLN